MICLDIYFSTKKWEMARWIIHNFYRTYISTTTKGILVYGIYAHFLWLCHYTHTFVIDNPIFTKKLFASREDVAIVDVDQSIIKFSLLKNKMSFHSSTNFTCVKVENIRAKARYNCQINCSIKSR